MTEDNWVGDQPTKCDLCEGSITDTFIDGRMGQVKGKGKWAIMCLECHKAEGQGLGQGKGQQYQKQDDEYIKIAG